RRSPGAVALTHERKHMTYVELEERSNRLARHLRANGVHPNSVVALSIERSFDLVIAILAILKTGSAYVSIDPADPGERAAFIARDSQGTLVWTDGEIDGSRISARVLDVRKVESASPEPIDSGATSASLAYIIYTSGSTGEPKGVPIRHDQVGRLLDIGR